MKTIAMIILIFMANNMPGFCQTNSSDQNDTLVNINKTVELIEREGLDTLTLKDIVLIFDTLSIAGSPVPKETYVDSIATRIQVFYNKRGIRKMYLNGTTYYFENEHLIKTHFRCFSPGYMGLCNGTYSEYENYFVNNNFCTTVKNKLFEVLFYGQCSCSDNIIINPSSIENIILMFNEQQ